MPWLLQPQEIPMQYRRLGSSGLQLSALSFGAWATFGNRVARGEARNLVAAAWDHGISFFDNAETYANGAARSEEHTSELQSLMRISYAVFCLKKKKTNKK